MGESPLHLASRSPRRAALLEAAGIPFVPGPFPDVDETPPPGVDAPAVARALAERKARAAGRLLPSGVRVLAADTVVHLDGALLGKPADVEDNARMLAALAGRRHDVSTGVALLAGGVLRSGVVTAHVAFRTLGEAEIEAYAATGEGRDKAGGYAIQGGARDFVAGLEGPRDAVIGLPVALVRGLLAEAGGPA